MSGSIALPGPRTRVQRRAPRGRYDRPTIDAILDEGFVCHVAFAHDGYPAVIPTAYVRRGDAVYLHGSTGNRMLRALRDGGEACLCVTLIDGLVLARSAFHHSINYRSVVVYGRAEEVTGEREKLDLLCRFVDHVVPSRTGDVRAPNPQELKQTLVLKIPITEASAKVRTGPPIDDAEDLSLPCWAGELPLQVVPGTPIPAPDLTGSPVLPDYVTRYRRGGPRVGRW